MNAKSLDSSYWQKTFLEFLLTIVKVHQLKLLKNFLFLPESLQEIGSCFPKYPLQFGKHTKLQIRTCKDITFPLYLKPTLPSRSFLLAVFIHVQCIIVWLPDFPLPASGTHSIAKTNAIAITFTSSNQNAPNKHWVLTLAKNSKRLTQGDK